MNQRLCTFNVYPPHHGHAPLGRSAGYDGASPGIHRVHMHEDEDIDPARSAFIDQLLAKRRCSAVIEEAVEEIERAA